VYTVEVVNSSVEVVGRVTGALLEDVVHSLVALAVAFR